MSSAGHKSTWWAIYDTFREVRLDVRSIKHKKVQKWTFCLMIRLQIVFSLLR